MTDYRKISHQLTAALSDIIDIAQAAIDKAEEEILSDPDEPTPPIRLPLPPKEDD